MRDADNFIFLLGGRDLEMRTIRELLEQAGAAFCDKDLAWGAKASDYRAEIGEAVAGGRVPVLVELELDFDLPGEKIIVVDHHGERAGADEPTSLHQVFALLGLAATDWTRRHELAAANDRGYIPEMLRVGASREEIAEIRRADRRAQGVTEDEERAAIAALQNLEILLGGRLTVAALPHARTSPLADRLEPALGGAGYQNLLVGSPRQVNFFGAGAIVFALKEKFPQSWFGGALPARGFWGNESAEFETVKNFILQTIAGGEDFTCISGAK